MLRPVKKRIDEHVIRYFSSRITISNGKVTKVTRPSIAACPLAGFLYPGLSRSRSVSIPRVRREIRRVIEDKIARIGFCTASRVVWGAGASIPYGASEVMAHGLRKDAVDAAVLVCDGAGTIVAAVPEVVQGVGARMHSVLRTSAIPEVIERLQKHGCEVVSQDGLIDQKRGVEWAADDGCAKIAVTVNAYRGERLADIRAIERRRKISVTILAVCTTGISKDRIVELERHADIVWACHSSRLHARFDAKARRKITKASPIYVLTEKGKGLMAGYVPIIFGLRKQER